MSKTSVHLSLYIVKNYSCFNNFVHRNTNAAQSRNLEVFMSYVFVIYQYSCLFPGKVYNITPYLEYHPGGIPEIMKGAGKDGTQLFDEVPNHKLLFHLNE